MHKQFYTRAKLFPCRCIFLPRFLSFINDASSNDQSMYVSIIYTRKIHRFDVKRSCVERRGTRVRPAPRPGNDSR